MLIDTIKNLHKCDNCAKSFIRKVNLTVHMLRHTGEKPYKSVKSCQICEKSFSRKQHLYNHKLMHTGEKPFTCESCVKSFTRKNIFNDDMSRTHQRKKLQMKIFWKILSHKEYFNLPYHKHW